MKQIIFTLCLSFLLSNTSQAYIPRATTIIKKMTRNNGRNTYTVVREVTLQNSSNQVKAKETWTIASGDKMKLLVQSQDKGNPWSFVIVYDKNKRQTLSSSKKLKTFKKSPEFFEPLFHDRSYRSMTQRMIGYKFIPDWVKNAPGPDYDNGKTKMTDEPFVRLAPIEGSVSYAIGANSNTSGDNSKTTLWVEQDSFLIKKGRLRSKADFTNSQFQSFNGGLKLPGEQTISWNDNVAQIKLMTVDTINSKKVTWSLTASESGTIPTDPLIKEFYSRFR